MLVVLDACVLYPPSLRDLLLTLAALDAFDVRWSETILDELTRNVLADNPEIDPEHFEHHTLAAMRQHFPEAMASVSADEIGALDNHPKDRHVAALALTTGADAVVTINVRDFRSQALAAAGVPVHTPGELVDQLLDEAPEVVIDAIHQIAGRWVNPQRPPTEIVSLLSAHPSMGPAMARAAALFD